MKLTLGGVHVRNVIYFAGGCFWGLEKYFDNIFGVVESEVGYANGNSLHPTYEQLKQTNHAETVKVTYDSTVISLNYLLDLFYLVIDPTSYHRQGNDVGSQYRTGIYYVDAQDEAIIKASLAQLQTRYDEPIAVEVLPLDNYESAEAYHQKYLDYHPSGYCHIAHDAYESVKNLTVDPYKYKKMDNSALRKLPKLSYEVTQHGATEPPYDNMYDRNFEQGLYVDITSGEPLFLSSDKFESGCGWPAFAKPIDQQAIAEYHDTSAGMIRTEVKSRVGNAHLGHLFEDGPENLGGLRYCINSAALRFIPYDELEQAGYGGLLSLFTQREGKVR